MLLEESIVLSLCVIPGGPESLDGLTDGSRSDTPVHRRHSPSVFSILSPPMHYLKHGTTQKEYATLSNAHDAPSTLLTTGLLTRSISPDRL